MSEELDELREAAKAELKDLHPDYKFGCVLSNVYSNALPEAMNRIAIERFMYGGGDPENLAIIRKAMNQLNKTGVLC